MKIFEVIYEDGLKYIIFANSKADAWKQHPMAWLVNEVIVK